MKQLITALLALWSVTTMAGLPPTTLGGQAGSSTTTFNFKVPNNLATKTATGGLLELGNENILENPDFEHKTFDTGWTCSLGTPTVETTKKFGTQSFKVASTGAGVRCYQYITNNASNLKGTQGVVRAMINSDDSALQVCALVDGTTPAYDTNCKTIPVTTTNTPWVAVEIPYIMGGTGNGIVIKSATTTTQAIYADKMVVAPAPYLTASVSGAKLLGTVTISGCASNWSTSSTTFVSFGTQTGCAYSVTGQAQAPSTNIPAIKFASLPAGDYRLEYESSFYNGTSGATFYLQFTDGTNTAREISTLGTVGSAVSGNGISQSISYSTTQSNVTFEIKGKVSSGTGYIYGTNTQPGVIKVWYFPPESRIYSQASQDTAWQPCTFSTLAWQGLGTVTNNLQCKRTGGDLRIRGKWTAGTTSATTAAIPLPNNWGNISILSTVGTNQIFGLEHRESLTTTTTHTLIGSGSGNVLNIALNIIAQSSNPASPANGNASVSNSETINVPEFSIPIQGWQDYGVIVGSFAGIEKCANDYECADKFTAQISATGVVSNENIDWLSGNCSVATTSYYTCTYKTFLKDGVNPLSSPMNCTITPTTGAYQVSGESNSSTTLKAFELRNQTGALAAAPSTIECSKGTNDFKPKTAKVATSIGVPTVPGITTTGTGNAIDTFTVSFAGANPGTTSATVCSATPCAIDQFGTSNAVSSVGWATGPVYTLNTNKTYTSLKCIVASQGAQYSPTQDVSCKSCNSVSFITVTSASHTAQNTHGTIDCKGSY